MKYHVWTEGCQMNVADSERVSSALEHLGYTHTSNAEDADVIVLNTCVVRQSAEDKAYGRLTSLLPIKRDRPEVVINLMGCLVGIKDHQPLRQRFPYVDVFSPPSDPAPLVEYLIQRDARSAEEAETARRFALMDGDLVLPRSSGGQVAGWIPVVYGCSHACAYCIIPYRRGVEVSRPPEEIYREARSLAAQGVKEITLLGQIVDRYGKDQPAYPTLAGLLRELSGIEGIERLRFLTSHPNWMTDELLECVAELPKVMPHIEVPNQSGDDDVLQAMKRGYTAEDYRRLVQKIRDRIPGVSIATDIIVGFPGETEAQFQNTYDLLAELKLDVVHLARYSPRAGTLSARSLEDNVPETEKWRRFRALERLQEAIVREIHATYLHTTVEVLFEDKVKKRWRGRTPTNKLVFVETETNLRGMVLPVKIIRTGPWSMLGELVS
ncbi:MAG TPA: tRNA (N6-isopentenyl adenosine(37)-C2)-methylthiotransferase MiaB [Anaerolineaceae bacterium]|jgi:tRNA-2-methylthio-N6-dimethylallyladenosine synthase|nr:tRNA (N6-isopentenyl adenosine(37)-C2)-methylthiotransferase MiaB [Anaerolineaceae bacterium]HNW13155.1 tRNA (N6-isopentenyl adenosine(37)-C2)-methylthiotransferase MiaB [Anaerolineaceae bacterium]HOQ69944.1 tRNA (N6-isopentenyl adenosine(37)-C2)-methylthiotransferase MiaB [Anaerolineaceae bacterium]HOS54105.1 tRNA (N6-isopentenyl adenosine(37)-C2)-methylthiotransferase MiaB [Anaerolineaceae bacterium]HPD62793.1 tRNA (N6-isopentenyl adenosine(37)-C2)-methylthiotransferase MiaB [Anaerolineace